MNALLHSNNLFSKPVLLHTKTCVQPKLTVNTPGDIYEEEADAMADRVMRMSSNETVKPVTGLIGKSLQRKCAHCEEEERKRRIMRKESSPEMGMQVSPSFASSLHASKGGGSPLPPGTKNFMENAFSTDFSSVRIHTDGLASEMSKGINAKAFTYGNDIYFNEGQFNPGSNKGNHLIGHELTHVVQQNEETSPGLVQRLTDEQLEFRAGSRSRIPENPTSPIDVNVVDESVETSIPWYRPGRFTGPLTGFFRGDVAMTNVSSMVANVLSFAGTHPIRRLNIMDHGNTSGIEIGNEFITDANFASYSTEFSRLAGHFASGGFVHLNHCDAGANQNLICMVAGAVGVTVYAQNGVYNPLYRFTRGDYVSCSSGGTFNPRANRPW